jgi:hypothetical protein
MATNYPELDRNIETIYFYIRSQMSKLNPANENRVYTKFFTHSKTVKQLFKRP